MRHLFVLGYVRDWANCEDRNGDPFVNLCIEDDTQGQELISEMKGTGKTYDSKTESWSSVPVKYKNKAGNPMRDFSALSDSAIHSISPFTRNDKLPKDR